MRNTASYAWVCADLFRSVFIHNGKGNWVRGGTILITRASEEETNMPKKGQDKVLTNRALRT